MGGSGSGVKNARRTNHFHAVDVRQYRKLARLRSGEPARLEWLYGLNGGPRSIPVNASIVWAAYHFGLRPFWECPKCGRRCCLLYLAEECGCRQCLHLAYNVCFEQKIDQVYRRAWKARARLAPPDGHSGPGDRIPDWNKPKGMHWRTFNRLREAADREAVRVSAELRKRLDRFPTVTIEHAPLGD